MVAECGTPPHANDLLDLALPAAAAAVCDPPKLGDPQLEKTPCVQKLTGSVARQQGEYSIHPCGVLRGVGALRENCSSDTAVTADVHPP